MQYGCIGEHLKHSFSKEIHAQIGNYPYEIKEIEPENLDFKEIFRGDASLPFGDDGKIRFKNSFTEETSILYSYDYKTGELFKDIGNTEFEVESIVPGYTDYVMESPNGKYFVEYDENSREPRLRISPIK